MESRISLFKTLTLSFLPLLIFVLAEEYLQGHFPEAEATRYALLLGIGMGLLQAAFIFAKERRLDKMILLDTALIIVMGGVSLMSGDDLFFKMKPALVQTIMIVIMGVAAFGKPQLILALTGRMLPADRREIQDYQLRAMQRSAKTLVALFSVHTLLIVYAAPWMSKKEWAFISGPLLYLLAGTYLLFTLGFNQWRQRKK